MRVRKALSLETSFEYQQDQEPLSRKKVIRREKNKEKYFQGDTVKQGRNPENHIKRNFLSLFSKFPQFFDPFDCFSSEILLFVFIHDFF